jgi:hypothetical protein
MGLPMTYLATISYKDGTGRSHSEETVLDLEAYIGTGGITRRRLHDIHKQLEEISKNVERWTDYAGLKVLTREDLSDATRNSKPASGRTTLRRYRRLPSSTSSFARIEPVGAATGRSSGESVRGRSVGRKRLGFQDRGRSHRQALQAFPARLPGARSRSRAWRASVHLTHRGS